MTKIPVAVSSCLLGDEVRYDGGHKRHRFTTDVLADYFEYQAICPEVAIGMGIPRTPIHVRKLNGEHRIVQIDDIRVDVTDDLTQYAIQQAKERTEICGYIFKSQSPSCGMERVKLYNENGQPIHNERAYGQYTKVFMAENPLIPCEEEGRLNDQPLRENFITRVYTLMRWRELVAQGLTKKDIVDFHTRHKFLILQCNEPLYRELGRMIAQIGKQTDLEEFAQSYILTVMQALKKVATRKRRVNVVTHILGFLKRDISKDDKQSLLNVIGQYHQGQIPFITVTTLFEDYFRRFPNEYMANQYFWNPYPRELALRSQI